MKKIFLRSLVFLLCFSSIKANAFENLAYTWRGFPGEALPGKLSLKSLEAHASQIDIFSSQAYHIDTKGNVTGSLNAKMVQIAKANNIKVMPLVGNNDFSPKPTHIFLQNKAAQDRAIQWLLRLCQKNHFYGLQIDFEGMSHLDREAFTAFYQKIADVLHKNGFKVSIALIPILTEKPPATRYLASRYRAWSGVYDYQPLGKASDFVTLMTYDQHGEGTTPGPLSGIRWNGSIIQYALKYIPANKISLGIPLHSGHWYTSPGHVGETDLDYEVISQKLKKEKINLKWDNEDKVHYAMYLNHFLYEYVFIEDAASFSAKLDLVKKYHLRGLSNWVLGEEDPAIWKLLLHK